MLNRIKGAIFDLDGVIVDTAKYHYLAWRRLADQRGIPFTEHDNERLKGVSRMRSLDIILELGGFTLPDEEKEAMAAYKNELYLDYIRRMDESEILPGAKEYMASLRAKGVRIALGSASKNAAFILERVGLSGMFDAVIDGTKVTKAKPDPEVFLVACESLGLAPRDCAVYEDAAAGVQAAKAAGIYVVGIGDGDVLGEADEVVAGLHELVS
ncbi:beta-phosphoglucomutase [Cohnella panacarvi]|uniref:beta-phosphoglucomutase n=1 Tax=Cohnella panacarvi TaxID=400776 RepID=UPI00047868C0|nr:beta-phosphoglucomutase [Cohnella panacarvi]